MMRRRDFIRAALAWTAAATVGGLAKQVEGPIRIEDTTWPNPWSAPRFFPPTIWTDFPSNPDYNQVDAVTMPIDWLHGIVKEADHVRAPRVKLLEVV